MSAQKLTETFTMPLALGKARNARVHRGERRHSPATAEIGYSRDQTEFFLAIDAWPTRRLRYPTTPELLKIARELRIAPSLGYTRNIEPIDLNCDWRNLRDRFVGRLRRA